MEGWNMININQNAFLFLVPPNFKQELQVQCVAFAIDTLFQNFIEKCSCVAIWADSTNWTHDICDQLAVELRTPLYEQSMPLETKKEMVKRTLDWYKKLGTAKVTKEVTATAFHSTGIEEWFNTKNRQPYTFRIKTKDLSLLSTQQEILERIDEVKNVRSSLEGFQFIVEQNIYVGSYSQTVERVKILPYQPKKQQQRVGVAVCATFACSEKVVVKFKA